MARYWAAFVFDLINPPEVGGGNPWTMVTSDDFLPVRNPSHDDLYEPTSGYELDRKV